MKSLVLVKAHFGQLITGLSQLIFCSNKELAHSLINPVLRYHLCGLCHFCNTHSIFILSLDLLCFLNAGVANKPKTYHYIKTSLTVKLTPI